MNYRTLFDLQGQRALVVGAGSGIGQATACGLAAFGAEVICADLRLPEAEATVSVIQQQGSQARAVQVDLRETQQIRTLLPQIGAVDVLVCTPSINVRKPLLQISDEEFE